MAVTVAQTSNFVEGADRVRRFQINGDTSYPTGGYDILAAMKTAGYAAGLPPVIIKRLSSVRHRTLASALVGAVVLVDTYTNGVISALMLQVVAPAGGGELAAGTSTANLNVELAYEGY